MFLIILDIKQMVYPIMWSSLETDGVDSKHSDIIERFKEMNI